MKYKLLYFAACMMLPVACESRMERNKRLICGNGEYKFWYVANAKNKYNKKNFVYFDREGRYQMYSGYKEITPVDVIDIDYPNFWEMANDSTIIYKWQRNRKDKMERTIMYISKDSLVVRYKDTERIITSILVSIPDSLKYLNVIPMIEKHSFH